MAISSAAKAARLTCPIRWMWQVAVLFGVWGWVVQEGNAQDFSVWANSNPGNFLTNSNWSGGTPNGTNVDAYIEGNPTNGGNFTLNGSMTLGSLRYTNAGVRGLTGTGTLTFHRTIGDGMATYSITFDSPGYMYLQVGSIVLNSTTRFINQHDEAEVFIASPISGSGGFIKSGSGVIRLNHSNTYSGATSIWDGRLKVTSGNGIPDGSAVSIDSGAVLQLGFHQEIGSLAGAGDVWLDNFLTGSAYLTTGGNNSSTTYSGRISGDGGLTKIGTGTLTLSGLNLYTGDTTISAGTLRLGASNRIFTTAVSISSGATFDLNNFNDDIDSLEGAGNVTLGSGTLTTGDSNHTTYSGVISGTGGLTKVGSGVFTLSGNNTYTGATQIDEGTLRLGTHNRISDSSAVSMSSGATFDLIGFNERIGSLAGAGNVTLGSGYLLTGENNSSTTFSGVISGTGRLNKVGTGTFTLSGANTYSGDTNIRSGTLRLGGHERLSNATAVDLLAAGTVFNLNGFNETIGSLEGEGNVALGSGTLTTGNSSNTTFSGVMSGTGGLTKVGTGQFTLSGANTYTGSTTISAGTLRLGAADRISNSSAISVSSPAIFNLNNFNETIGSLAGSGSVTLGSGNLTMGGNNSSTTYSGVISGTGRIQKLGTGTFTLSGVNTYTGATWIDNGTLRLGGHERLNNATGVDILSAGTFDLNGFNEQIGSLSGAGGNVTLGNGTLTTGSNNNSTTYSGVISGTGELIKVGSGMFTLSGSNTYTGPTQINVGTLRLGASNRISNSSAVSVSGGATFDLNGFSETISSLAGAGNVALGSGTLTTGNSSETIFSGVISGTGGLTKVGSGTFTLSGVSSYTGPTQVNAGTLALTGNVSSNVLVNSAGTLAGTGTVFGSVVNGGTLAPGNLLPGLMTIDNDYTQETGGKLSIQLGGTTVGSQYDRLDINGTASFAGTLEVLLLGAYVPSVGNSFDILDWESLSGTFLPPTLPALADGLAWNTSQLYSTGVISVVSAGVPADYNNDGVVDAADYVVWQKHHGTSFDLPNEVPGTTPGEVTAADYNAWYARFGLTSGMGASSSVSAPEPTSVFLLMLGTGLGAGFRVFRVRRRVVSGPLNGDCRT